MLEGDRVVYLNMEMLVDDIMLSRLFWFCGLLIMYMFEFVFFRIFFGDLNSLVLMFCIMWLFIESLNIWFWLVLVWLLFGEFFKYVRYWFFWVMLIDRGFIGVVLIIFENFLLLESFRIVLFMWFIYKRNLFKDFVKVCEMIILKFFMVVKFFLWLRMIFFVEFWGWS